MTNATLIALLLPILCLISNEVLSEKIVADGNPGEVNHRKWIPRIILDHLWDYNITSKTNHACTRHFEVYRQHLNNFTTWALQMFDSSDLVASGFLVGDNYNLGNFEECLNAQVPKELDFSAQYCLPTFKFSQMNLKKSEIPDEWDGPVWGRLQTSKKRIKVSKEFFNLAFCIPSTCSSDDLETSLQNLLEGPMRDAAYNLSVTADSRLCTTKGGPLESNGHLIMKYFIYGLSSILLICSAVDILLAVVRDKNHNINNCSFSKATGLQKWLLPFSIPRSLRQLTAPPTSPEDYKILHAIKTVLTILTVVAHRGMVGCGKGAIVNWNYFENKLYGYSLFYIALPLPDFFLCITGFLSCISMMKQLEKGTFNVRTHIINKLIRVLPPYLFVIACTIFILPYLGSGPLWKTTIEPEAEFCRNSWLANLLFINNYYTLGRWCLPHDWYIAADMHYFVVGSIIVYLCWRWESQRIIILGTAFFLSFLFPFMTVYRNNYEGLLKLYPDFLTNPRSHDFFLKLYMKSQHRFGGYITGIIYAFLFRNLQTGYTFSKATTFVGVLIGVLAILAASAARHFLHSPTEAYGAIAHALFAGLHTQLLGIGLMTIVILQITASFGFLDPIFVTFSRVAYWTFLLNIPIIFVRLGSNKTPIHMTYENLGVGGQHWGDIVLTYFFAVCCHILIDVPINHIKPIILKYAIKASPSSTKKRQ